MQISEKFTFLWRRRKGPYSGHCDQILADWFYSGRQWPE